MTTIHTETITITSGDLSLPCYWARPQADGVYPAVVVVQEIFGVNVHIRDVADRIAAEGYVAIAPPIYERQVKGLELGYTETDIVTGREYKNATQASELLQDIQAVIDYLYTQPFVKTTGVGTIGFCFGGHVVYLAAVLPEVQATASFYGAGIPTWQPGEPTPTLSRTPAIHGTLYAFFGEDDASIPPEHVQAIATTLQANQVEHKIFTYDGAGHGFFCDRRSSYNETAAAAAWVEVKQLFQARL